MRYFIGLLVIIFIFVIGIALLFGGHKKTTSPKPVVLTLPDYASTNAQVSFNTDGTINGDDLHRAIRITVSRDQRTLEIIQGYNGKVINKYSQDNNENAYSAFLKSLNSAGFLAQRKGTKLEVDYSTICPLENRYALALNQGSQTISKLWSSDCGNSSGDFGGAFDVVQALFQDQITGYQNLTDQVELNP
jgi:hypothetical protein